ncbi:MBL fold metallo-hydrolase [Rouxiella sp. Mn2063]|uniref:MBL fold metallo-hydrolase n=1 Tax=Rouxiella sp. Mn2063 TaxID=3395262 RepID=UPI003BD0A873
MNPSIETFFDEKSCTYSYIVSDPASQSCAIIDSVLDYDHQSGNTSTGSADKLIAYIAQHNLKLEWLLETHVHADHISASHYIKSVCGGEIAIGEHIKQVQEVFGPLFNQTVGPHHFDRLLADGETFNIGNLSVEVIHTPGHTPACMTYVIGNVAFVGDTLFMPDYGTARCDFPGGDASMLYRSIQKLFALPDHTQLFMCHDYKAPGRDEFCNETTVYAQRTGNIQIHQGISEDEFVAMRLARDATLKVPALIIPSVQLNIRAGELPEPASNGIRYLSIPLNTL